MTPSRDGEICSVNMKPRPADITCKWITVLLIFRQNFFKYNYPFNFFHIQVSLFETYALWQ